MTIVAYMNSKNGFISKENKNPDYNVPLCKFEWQPLCDLPTDRRMCVILAKMTGNEDSPTELVFSGPFTGLVHGTQVWIDEVTSIPIEVLGDNVYWFELPETIKRKS